MTVKLTSVKFWINAFIPRDIPNLTINVPKGTHTGKTMIPGPTPVSDCYLTDQRSFSNHIHAKSRMHSEFKMALTGSKLVFTQWHNCDKTCEIDCEDGDVECDKKGSTGKMKFTFPISPNPGRPIDVKMKAGSNNPCSSGSPDIDYDGVIRIDLGARSIEFMGRIDEFPAFEAYATINDGAGVNMIQKKPKAGKTPWNLFGGASENVRQKLRDLNKNGIFQKVQK